MASAQRVTYFKAHIEDKPGTLLAVLKEFKAKNLGLTGLWASAGEPGWTDLYLIAKKPEKVRAFWKNATPPPEEGTAFFVKGNDTTGALVKALDAIARSEVNLIRTDALAVGGKYGTFFLVSPADAEKAAKALGAK
jgi:prephenate dehydratase